MSLSPLILNCDEYGRGFTLNSRSFMLIKPVKTTTPGSWLFVVLFYWCLSPVTFQYKVVDLKCMLRIPHRPAS